MVLRYLDSGWAPSARASSVGHANSKCDSTADDDVTVLAAATAATAATATTAATAALATDTSIAVTFVVSANALEILLFRNRIANRNNKRFDTRDTNIAQLRSSRLQRAASCPHIIDKRDASARKRTCRTAQLKSLRIE